MWFSSSILDISIAVRITIFEHGQVNSLRYHTNSEPEACIVFNDFVLGERIYRLPMWRRYPTVWRRDSVRSCALPKSIRSHWWSASSHHGGCWWWGCSGDGTIGICLAYRIFDLPQISCVICFQYLACKFWVSNDHDLSSSPASERLFWNDFIPWSLSKPSRFPLIRAAFQMMGECKT